MNKVLLLVCLVSVGAFAGEPVTLKFSSLAPRESPWGQVLRTWGKAVHEKTKGEVELEFFWNSTQGDEPAQIAKMKTGQLDGAAVTSVGLSEVVHDVNALQLPGLFQEWEPFDKAREAMRPKLEKQFQDSGFELIGWGDVGLDHLISKGYAVHLPADLKGKKPWVWREDPIMAAVCQVLGVTPDLTSAPEAITELTSGNANMVDASALAVEQLQWSSRLDHLNLMVVAPNIGGMLMRKQSLDALKPEQRAAVLDTGKVACKALTSRIREEDKKALERLKQRMEVVTPTADELAQWKKVFADTRARLAKGTFSPEVVKQIEDAAK